MRPRYRLELGALQDIEGSIDYLLSERPDVAPRFVEACRETFELIAEQPGIGRRYEPIDARLEGIRVFPVTDPFGNWLVFYRELSSIVHIERVLHGARDIPAALQ